MKKAIAPYFFITLFFIPMSIKAQKPVLNHIALPVYDLQKSTAFYRDVIGLDTIPEPFHDGRHTWLSIGKYGAIHLIGGGPAGISHDKNNHICFSVSSLHSFISRLEKASINFEDARGKPGAITLRPDGVQQIYFKDPDGFWIEINDAKQ